MRYIFADQDRSLQITRIKDGIAEFRSAGRDDPKNFGMHQVYDELMQQVSDHFLGYWSDKIAVVGLGGYGRKEMSPYSDIDLLFLRPEDSPEGIYRGVRSILYLLWDAKVELGHSVRTVDECRQEAENDLAVLTSLMDVRLVWGNPDIVRDLLITRQQMISETEPLEIYSRIEAEIRKSYEKFGHTIYLLEPHLKEGPGSLRYIQLITWLVRSIFGCNSLDDLPYANVCGAKSVEEVHAGMQFLAEVRTRLHFIQGRRDDRLKFDAQIMLAKQMCFEDSPGRRGVEVFMREYYRHAATMDFFGRRVLAKARLLMQPKLASETKILKLNESFYIGSGGIFHFHPENFGNDLQEIISGFRLIAETGTEFDIRMVDYIRRRLQSPVGEPTKDEDLNRHFLELFKTKGYIAKALNAMMKIGFLEIFIPEFSWVRFMPQHDIYHQYTVDLHTMAVLENMDAFARQDESSENKMLNTIFSRLDRPEVLFLAGLFHDIAKGRGPGHEARGEQIARPVLQRLGVDVESIDEVCWLIRNHLAMTHLAFKKDLHDEALINRFAENVMSRRKLDLLTLLTHADLMAVGPTAINSWRKMLLEELYYRTVDVIEDGGPAGEDLLEWIREIKIVVREKVQPSFRDSYLEEYLASAPSRYFLDFYPGVISEHYNDLRIFMAKEQKTALELQDVIARKIDHKRPGYSSITLIVKDRQGLFYRIAGTLSANRINILSAWSHSIGDIAVATLHVNDIPEGPLDDPERWEHFKSDFRKVMAGSLDIDELVAKRRMKRPYSGTFKPRFPVKVEIDNAASDQATIIEVYAHDRPGLLYDITRKLFDIGLNIVLTKITTEVDQALDVFYVKDAEFEKIVDFEILDEVKSALQNHLATMENEHFSKIEGVISF